MRVCVCAPARARVCVRINVGRVKRFRSIFIIRRVQTPAGRHHIQIYRAKISWPYLRSSRAVRGDTLDAIKCLVGKPISFVLSRVCAGTITLNRVVSRFFIRAPSRQSDTRWRYNMASVRYRDNTAHVRFTSPLLISLLSHRVLYVPGKWISRDYSRRRGVPFIKPRQMLARACAKLSVSRFFLDFPWNESFYTFRYYEENCSIRTVVLFRYP